MQQLCDTDQAIGRNSKMLSRIVGLDEVLLAATNRIRTGEMRTSEFLLRAASHLGDGYLWVVLGIAGLLTGRTKATWAGVMAAMIGLGVSLILKRTCKRARPIADAHWGRFVAPDQYSFPSGHTTTAVALATVTVGYWSGIATFMCVCAACIAASRTLLGFHYLSDVLGGVFLGLLSGCLAVLILP